jgi:hypothetical protein
MILETKDIVIVILSAAVIALALVTGYDFFTFPKLRSGYTEIEGFLELRAYPKISESVPTVMVYVLIPMYDQSKVYLTEDGLPLSSLEGFSLNDLVKIEGVMYSLNAVDGSETYWMIEVFSISEGD